MRKSKLNKNGGELYMNRNVRELYINRLNVKRCFLLAVITVMIAVSFGGCTKKNQISVSNNKLKKIVITITDKKGKNTKINVATKKKSVGEALLDAGLIEGKDSGHGFYVTKVNGIKAKYEDDKTYWAFYINGKYATTYVDQTEIKDGTNYEFKVEGDGIE